MISQRDAIREHLEKHGSINPIEALTMFDCYRLSARIKELRSTMNIVTVRIPYINYQGKKKCRTVYKMSCVQDGGISG